MMYNVRSLGSIAQLVEHRPFKAQASAFESQWTHQEVVLLIVRLDLFEDALIGLVYF